MAYAADPASHLAARQALATTLLLLASFGCSDDSGSGSGPTPTPATASLLLVTLDTTRADRIGAYGYPDAGTPNLDRLAAAGARFTSARTAAPLTLPSHASILTGLYPATHGIHDNGIASLSPRADTLAEAAKRQGMNTGAFIASFVVSSRFGLGQGFDHWSEPQHFRVKNGSLLVERPASEVVRDALEWIEQTEPRFFAWVHLFDPHHPYAPPEPFATKYADDPYQGEIAFVDEQLGLLFESARARDPDVVIIVVADHGEGLGEHGELSHGPFIYDSTMRVPLLVYGPGVPAGQVIDQSVSTIDIAPTVRDLLGLSEVSLGDGESLVPTFHGETLARRRPVALESYWAYLHQRWSPLVAVTDGSTKFILAPGEEWFDLRADPGEVHNTIASAPAALLARLRTAARAYHRDQGAFADAYVLSSEDRRSLSELGYLSGGGGGPLPPPGAERRDPKDGVHLLNLRDDAITNMHAFDAKTPPDAPTMNRMLAMIEDLDRALQEDPGNPALSEMEGLCLYRIGRYADALPLLQAGLSADPTNVDTRYAVALCLAGLLRRDEAIAELEQLLVYAPDFALALSILGTLHQAEGRDPQALPYYEHFLEVWPHKDDGAATRMRIAIKQMKDRIAAAKSTAAGG